MSLEKIFYIKEALGKNGKPIKVYKFITMIPLEKQNVSLNELEHNGHGKPKYDPRITKTGKILRKFWLDETPQFYNLFKGDLKLVGIRPMTEEDWKIYPTDIKEKSLKEKPGLFGQQYANDETEDFNDCIKNMRKYLFWEGNHSKRDAIYLGKIVYKILFNGIRSS
jgi:lipopolysaccharide/colanic/teichoic acid biosynthesis glycosyltransferase